MSASPSRKMSGGRGKIEAWTKYASHCPVVIAPHWPALLSPHPGLQASASRRRWPCPRGPQARVRYRIAPAAAISTSYTPVQLGTIYSMPPNTDGSGQTLAIIELGGGFGQPDLDSYFSGLGLPTPVVRAVGVDGASNVAGG